MTPPWPSSEAAGPSGGEGVSSAENPLALHVVEGEEVLGDNLLDSFHCLMKKFFSALSLEPEDIGDVFSMDISICGTLTNAVRGLLCHISNWAFNTLDRQYEQILSPRKRLLAARVASAQRNSYHCEPSSLQSFCFHLKCCITLLYMLEFDLNLLMGKSQILVKMLRELCCPDIQLMFFSPQTLRNDIWSTGVHNSISHEIKCGDMSGFECSKDEMRPVIPVVLSILEVFADELLVHQGMRKHFATIYNISSTCDTHLAPDSVTCYIGIIFELLCSHFLLSSYDEKAFGRLFQSMFSCKAMETEGLKLRLTAALALLGMPTIISAPYMLRSHIILLVSRCIAGCEDQSATAMDCYMGAFEQSVILYTCHSLSSRLYYDSMKVKPQSKSRVLGRCALENDFDLSFGQCVRKGTQDTINSQIQKWLDSCSQQSDAFLHWTKAEVVSSCMAYMTENRHIIMEPWREETCLLLSFMLQRIAGEAVRAPPHEKEEINRQEIYFVAALLKLMGSSLLKIVVVLSERSTENSNGSALGKEHEFISDIVGYFGSYSAGRYVLWAPSAARSSGRWGAGVMLAHLTSLLFCSIDQRLHPLWEGCMFVIMAVMNLLVLEEGNLDTPRTMCGFPRESLSYRLSLSKVFQVPPRRSSIAIASNLQKLQDLYLKKEIKYLAYEPSRVLPGGGPEAATGGGLPPAGKEEAAAEAPSEAATATCNGAAFLRCIIKDEPLPDWDDLADFIEARPGKDYTHWLQNRKRYNRWKHQKMATSKSWERKLALWKKLSR